jgi:hypothetical protein
MSHDALISPFLENDIRTMHQVCLDIAKRDGTPMPDCRNCERRQVCLRVERNHRRYQKRNMFELARKRH